MRFCLMLIFFVVYAFSAGAREKDSVAVSHDHKNSIAISLLGTQFPHTYHVKSRIDDILNDNLIDAFSVSYERIVYKRLEVGAEYSAWDNHPHLQQISGMSVYEPLKAGSWEYMQNYKMADLYLAYSYDHFKKHLITAGAGASYTSGDNVLVDTIYHTPGWKDGTIQVHTEGANYFGAMAFAHYDYLCWRGKLAVGYTVLFRTYPHWYSSEWDFGFSIKCSF